MNGNDRRFDKQLLRRKFAQRKITLFGERNININPICSFLQSHACNVVNPVTHTTAKCWQIEVVHNQRMSIILLSSRSRLKQSTSAFRSATIITACGASQVSAILRTSSRAALNSRAKVSTRCASEIVATAVEVSKLPFNRPAVSSPTKTLSSASRVGSEPKEKSSGAF